MPEQWNIPTACRVSNVIFKKAFYDNADLSAADKKLFTDGIHKITWHYSLKEENCFIRPYKDEVREYAEIEVIEAELHQQEKEKRIAEIIMRAIPYPMLLILRCEEQAQLWVAHQRSSQNDSEKNVLEEMICTQWLEESELSSLLDFTVLRKIDFYALYIDIMDAISVNNAKHLSDEEDLSGQQARQLLKKAESLEVKITALRAQLKKETQFNRKVELNMEIKRLEKEVVKI